MTLHIDRITIAVNDMPGMVAFYNAVFGADLARVSPDGPYDFHLGRLGGLELFFCPNTLTQIQAEKNRVQLRIVVADVAATMQAALAAGGQLFGEQQTTAQTLTAGISDPDGNSIELIQHR